MNDSEFQKVAENACAATGFSWGYVIQCLRDVVKDPNAGGPLLENELPIEEQIEIRKARLGRKQAGR